jgi:hypothetical protein
MTEAAHGAVPQDVDSPATAQVERSSEASSQPPKSEQASESGRTSIDKLAEKDDVTEWVEARDDAKADELEAEGREDEIPEHRRKSRYQRLKESRERAQAEAAAAKAEAQALRERGTSPEAIEMVRVQERFKMRAEKVREQLPDYEQVMQSAPDVPLSDEAFTAIAYSEHGPRMAYELAAAPEILAQFAAQPPHEQARIIGRMEMLIESEGRPQRPQPRLVTKAPAPITPPKGGGASPPTDVRKLAGSDDITAYAKARDAENRKAGRR